MTNPDPVADIKARLNIEDVVSPYVQLKRAGRSLKGLCPWHNEKTPSFIVSPERQMAYCFGCNKGGDMFTFTQEIEGVDFVGAMKILAEKAGVTLPERNVNPERAKASKDHRDTLRLVNQAAMEFYRDLLCSTKEGKQVLKYLEGRGFTAQTVENFQLGLSPDSFEDTFNHLVQKKCSKKDLLELGLLSSKDTSGDKTYDRFRRRLMFPIWNAQGYVVGFGGRALKAGDDPKYMNSPESPIYHKSDVLYGFYRAKQSIRQEDLAIVVEGYMDVMASHQAGVPNVVASSGTALTENQLKLIKRLTNNVAFAFDTDNAGQQALMRAVELGQGMGLHIRVIQIPKGKDPADCVKEDPELWKKAVQEASFYLDYFLNDLQGRFDLSTLEGKRQAAQYFLPLLKKASSLERDHFIKQLGFALKTDPQFIYDEYNALKKDPYATTRSHQSVQPKSSADFSMHQYFLGLLLQFPSQINNEILNVSEDLFDESLKKVYKQVRDQYNDGACVDPHVVLSNFEEEERQKWEVIMLLAETKNAHLSDEMIQREMLQVGASLQRQSEKRRATQLMHEIQLAREADDKEREHKLFQEYSRLYHSS